MKRWSIIMGTIMALQLAAIVEAEPILDDATRNVCNTILQDVHRQILSETDKYPELSEYNDSHLTTNAYGIDEIRYEHEYLNQMGAAIPYGFGLTIVPQDVWPYEKYGQKQFHFGFPLLELKMTGYILHPKLRKLFDISPLLEVPGLILWDHQQNYLPLRLTVIPQKDVLQTGEEIRITAILTNTTRTNILVKDLGPETLFFKTDNTVWETRTEHGDNKPRSILLRAGSEIRKEFIGPAYLTPISLEIFAVYEMAFSGVQPSARVTISVDQ